MNTNNLKTITSIVSSTLIAGAILGTVAADTAHAQPTKTVRRSAKSTGFASKRVNPATKRVTMELQNASARKAISQLFQQTGVDYSLDASVGGNVSLKVRNQPFEVALRTLVNSSSQPLTYFVENGTYFIKPIPTMSSVPATARVAQTAPVEETEAQAYAASDVASQYLPVQQLGSNTAFVPSTGTQYAGNTTILPGGFGNGYYGDYSGYGNYGGYSSGNAFFQPGGFSGGYNNFGGGYAPSFQGATISGPGFFNPATGIGAYYGSPNGMNFYSTRSVYLGY